MFSFINLFNSALHVSGNKFAHPQEQFLAVYVVKKLLQRMDEFSARNT